MYRCEIGAKCIIHPGVVIGADGFGFVPGPTGLVKVPQTGIVVIGNDVEIGANTTIDRARFGKTVIKDNVKIDDQVMVAHNVVVGERSILVTANNIFLAPLAGYTNYAFRRVCKDSGAGLCYTEMVSAKGLKYGSENTQELLYTDENEGLTAVQIFGNEPDTMRLACEHEKIVPFPIVDINRQSGAVVSR